MAEIEDVGTAAPLFEQLVYPSLQRRPARPQKQVVERALDGLAAGLDPLAKRGAGLGVEGDGVTGTDLA